MVESNPCCGCVLFALLDDLKGKDETTMHFGGSPTISTHGFEGLKTTLERLVTILDHSQIAK